MYKLEENEKCLAGGGYNNGGVFFEIPTGHNDAD